MSDQTDVHFGYDAESRGTIARYKMISYDHRGLELMEGYIGISIDDSEYISVDSVIKIADEMDKKWLEFSEIQCATNLRKDKESIKRFNMWWKTGDPEDAWS